MGSRRKRRTNRRCGGQQFRRRAEAADVLQGRRMYGHKLALTKIALNFVSPVVSPEWVKMGLLLIIGEEHDKHSTRFNQAICTHLMT